MENQKPTPNTKDADKPELPADGCSLTFFEILARELDMPVEKIRMAAYKIQKEKDVQSERTRKAVETLIAWLADHLGHDNATKLIEMLNGDRPFK